MKVTELILYSSTYCQHVMACGVELEDLKEFMSEQQPRLLKHYERHLLKIPSFGIELNRVPFFREFINLQLPSDAPPVIIEEVADRLYWDEGLESFGLPARLGQPRIDLFKNLYEIAFEASGLVLGELRALLALRHREDVAEFEFGQAPTYPLIADFIRAISSNPAYNVARIKENLSAHYEDVLMVLTQGKPYDIIAIALQRGACLWILDDPLLIKDNVEVLKILCSMYARCGADSSPAFRQRFLDVSDQIKDFFVRLSRLPERAAVEKLLLMIGFPQYATYIYEHTAAEALKFTFRASLTPWRAEVANRLKWERMLLTEHSLLIFLDYQKDYYDGYLANSRFDELVCSLGRNRLLVLFNGEDPETFAELLRKYKRRAVMEERLGTVYSILQEEFSLAGPINPLSEEVDDNFERQVIIKCARKHDHWKFWLGQKYLQNTKVLMSRLAFYPKYNMYDYLDDSFRDDTSNFINIVQDIHSSIAKICSLPENLTLFGQTKKQYPYDQYELFDMVRDNLIEHCVPEVCIPSILNYLDGGGEEEFVTSKLLPTLLRKVAWKHFSEAKYNWFDCSLEELKTGLLSLLEIKQ